MTGVCENMIQALQLTGVISSLQRLRQENYDTVEVGLICEFQASLSYRVRLSQRKKNK